MKKKVLIPIFAVILLSGCAHEFNQVYKSQDYAYKYEYAKECFARGKYAQAITLLQELVTIQKGRRVPTTPRKAYTCSPWRSIATWIMRARQ